MGRGRACTLVPGYLLAPVLLSRLLAPARNPLPTSPALDSGFCLICTCCLICACAPQCSPPLQQAPHRCCTTALPLRMPLRPWAFRRAHPCASPTSSTLPTWGMLRSQRTQRRTAAYGSGETASERLESMRVCVCMCVCVVGGEGGTRAVQSLPLPAACVLLHHVVRA